MSDGRAAWLAEQLRPDDLGSRRAELYVILDGARDPRIHRIRPLGRFGQRCLYAGALPRPLAEVAPYILHVEPHTPLALRIIADSWGASWGIWLQSTATIDELRLHFRRLLTVQDERGTRLIFRYYDPRVLREYLPTCTVAELRSVFGPVRRFAVESELGDTVIEFELDDTGMCTRHRRSEVA